jgi:predicted nucleotidyltransferase
MASPNEGLLAQCRWPDLPAPYAEALRQAVRFILERCPDTRGIVVSGTILRGNPAPSSDLDIYVIRREPQRQRVQKFFNGVPAEIFINPEHKVADYFAVEVRDARPITAHMLATGFTILDCDGVIASLQARARQILETPPDPGAETLTAARYTAAARYEDAMDIVRDRPATARMILGLAIYQMLHYHFLSAHHFMPRDKDLLDVLETWDAALCIFVRRFYAATTLEEALAAAEQIADRTIATRGFFEWESTPATVVV